MVGKAEDFRDNSFMNVVLLPLWFVLLLLNTASCQSIGTMREISLTNQQVILAVEVDPMNSNPIFNWNARVNGSPNNTALADVFLNGAGNPIVFDIYKNRYDYSYTISNNPAVFPTSPGPWNTSLTFHFPDETTTFRFVISQQTFGEVSSREYSGRTAGSNTDGGDSNEEC